MNIISRKNYLLFFTAAIFILLVYMGFSIFSRNRSTPSLEKEVARIQTQSESTEIESIEKDLMETDLNNLDRELNAIEAELNSAY